MNHTDHLSKPASSAEISEALRVLFEAGLPFQRGVHVDGMAMAYVEALRGMTVEGIQAGIRKFIRGECEDVSLRFVPTPPELARIVRTSIVASRIPPARQLTREPSQTAAEQARMRLKMPVYQHAVRHGLIDRLAQANRQGFEAMVLLAGEWGIQIPDELNNWSVEENARQWAKARNRAWADIERNPPPFMRGKFVESFEHARAA